MSKFELVSFVFFVTLCLAFVATVLPINKHDPSPIYPAPTK